MRSLLAIVTALLLVACGPAAAPKPTATAVPVAPSPTAKPAPTATATPLPAPSSVVICKTGGIGAFVRAEPKGAGIVAWPDNTKLDIIGADRNVDGETWRNVRDPKGSAGWIKTDYLCPAS